MSYPTELNLFFPPRNFVEAASEIGLNKVTGVQKMYLDLGQSIVLRKKRESFINSQFVDLQFFAMHF